MRVWLAIVTMTALLAGCSTTTPYQRAGTDGSRYGFDEQRVEADRYIITFSGNSRTDRNTVETFLLYRAAELTVERGYDHFMLVRREMDEDRRLVETGGSGYSSLFGPRYYHPRYGWLHWRDPFWDDVNIREVTRFEASAEIVMASGPAPADPDAYDAREVISNLGPRVRAENEGS